MPQPPTDERYEKARAILAENMEDWRHDMDDDPRDSLAYTYAHGRYKSYRHAVVVLDWAFNPQEDGETDD